MTDYKCEECNDTGFYGNKGPGGSGSNDEFQRCECKAKGPTLCEHGSLKRQCLVCELLEELDLAITEVGRLEKLALDVREPVRWFAEQMEATLKENDHKGGWKGSTFRSLFRRLEQEAEELKKCFGWYGIWKSKTFAPHITKEAADVANFAMMIADNMRAEIPELENDNE